MVRRKRSNSPILDFSVQINDGFRETSGDGATLAFDTKYGIMFCVYMPGSHGSYGESRGRICLSYFPASQPTNFRTVEISAGDTEYVPNLISLGAGKVRVFYEKNSRADCDHPICFRDFDYLTEKLGEERTVMVRMEDGSLAPLTQSLQFRYLEERGFRGHTYRCSEQIIFGGCTIFRGEDGLHYGALPTFLSEVIFYRSRDDLATLEFFAVCPEIAQYELDYKMLNGVIHAIYRTEQEEDSCCYVKSEDGGLTWTKPIRLKGSIACRPRMIIHGGHILMGYNVLNEDTGNRPAMSMGRTEVKLIIGEADDPNENTVAADLYSKYGIVNITLCDVMGDAYMAYSTSELALEYHNGNPKVRGKDAIRYVKLGDLLP